MPKSTFFNLPDEKREKIIAESIVEFRDNNFDAASINRIVERSGISKGSFYQYFEDKEDLYLYIISLIAEKKMEYFSPTLMNPKDHGFYEILTELYRTGLQFAFENPDYLEIGNRMMRDTSGSVMKKIMDSMGSKGDEVFIGLLEQAKMRGEVRKDIDSALVARLLVNMQLTLIEYYFENHRDKGYSVEIMDELEKLFKIVKNGIS